MRKIHGFRFCATCELKLRERMPTFGKKALELVFGKPNKEIIL